MFIHANFGEEVLTSANEDDSIELFILSSMVPFWWNEITLSYNAETFEGYICSLNDNMIYTNVKQLTVTRAIHWKLPRMEEFFVRTKEKKVFFVWNELTWCLCFRWCYVGLKVWNEIDLFKNWRHKWKKWARKKREGRKEGTEWETEEEKEDKSGREFD